jgi:hypothetical protein
MDNVRLMGYDLPAVLTRFAGSNRTPKKNALLTQAERAELQRSLGKSLAPRQQEQALEDLRRLALNAELGYVLLGDKPAVYLADVKEIQALLRLEARLGLNQNDYAVVPIRWQPTTGPNRNRADIQGALFIGREAMREILQKNIKLFRQELQSPQLSEQKLMEALCGKAPAEVALRQRMINHEALFGILLGYGTENSKAYQRYTLLLDEVYYPKGWHGRNVRSTFFLARTDISPSPEFSDPQQELGSLMKDFGFRRHRSGAVQHPVPRRAIHPQVRGVNFRAIQGSEESRKLIAHYDAVQERLVQLSASAECDWILYGKWLNGRHWQPGHSA